LLCGLLETDGEVKLGFNGDLYPTAGASKVITTQGDIVRGDASGNRERLGIGSNLQQLQSNGTTLSWQTIAGGGATVTVTSISDFTDGQTTTSTSLTALAGGTSITLTSVVGGGAIIVASMMAENNTGGRSANFCISDDGSAVGKSGVGYSVNAGEYNQITVSYIMATDGSEINMMWSTNGGGSTILLTNGAGTNIGCYVSVKETS